MDEEAKGMGGRGRGLRSVWARTLKSPLEESPGSGEVAGGIADNLLTFTPKGRLHAGFLAAA